MFMDELGKGKKPVDRTLADGRSCPNCGRQHSTDVPCARQPRSAGDALIGKTIGGKYQIIALAGRGGMSRVYKARQLPIDRIVALKMLQSQLSNEQQSLLRFLQEARATSQVSHPNVVSVFDFGVAEEEHQPYLVTDFLEGETLSQLLKRERRLSYEEAIPIFEQICDGLAAAHEHGVIHRDIKPSNIVLQNVPEGRRVRLVDFGIAKMIDVEAQHLTKTGEVFGSPFYMSPEQCEGMPLDGRSDIYSLGVVLYETLSGTLPLAGRTVIETMALHLQTIPPSLQKAAGADCNIPLALENIVFKMMEKSPDKRYASMIEVKRALQQFASGQSEVLSGNLSFVRRELTRKSRMLTLAAVSVAFLGLIGVIAYPHACAAIARQQLDKGTYALKTSSFREAEPYLKSAADLSRKAGDMSIESRSLSALINVYVHTGDRDQLKHTRERRRVLIKTELGRLGISKDSIERLITAGSAEGELIASRDANAVNSPDSFGNIASPQQMPEASQLSAARFMPSAGPAPAPFAATDPAARQPLSGTTSGAITPSPPGGGGADRPSKEDIGFAGSPEAESRRGTLDTFARAGGGEYAPAPASDFIELKKKAKTLRSSNDRAVIADRRVPGPLPTFANNKMNVEARLAGAQRKRESDGRSDISKTAQTVDIDRLDRLQAAVEFCLENNLFAQAKACADRAIGMYTAQGIKPDAELAGIYCARAWSDVNLHQRDEALADIKASEAVPSTLCARSELAQLKGVQSVVYQESGSKAAAAQCAAQARKLLDAGVPQSAILAEALKRYAASK